MKIENIQTGKNVEIDPSSAINNIVIGDNVRIAKQCSVFGGPSNQLSIGNDSYVGMKTIIEGFNEKITIGEHVSIAPNVFIISGSGPNASKPMQKLFPILRAPVTIGDHSWIGSGSVIVPGVTLGKFCVVAVNSFVKDSFPDFAIVGGSPAKVIRMFTDEERAKLMHD